MHQAEIIVLLFALVAVLAVLACKVALPYPIGTRHWRTCPEFRAAIAGGETQS